VNHGHAGEFSIGLARPATDLEAIGPGTGGAELFFIANGSEQPLEFEGAFRVTGKRAELWDPDTARVTSQRSKIAKDGRSIVAVRLAPAGSVFVVFRDGPAGIPSPEVVRRGQPQSVPGPWRVSFPAGWGAPEYVTVEKPASLSEHANPGVKYFGGTADYETEFPAPAGFGEPGRTFVPDLGEVHEVAAVELNGQSLGPLWKLPFAIEVTRALRPGKNSLRVTVATAFINRFIGDAQ